jgi:uncharacterized membrane protein
MPKLAFFLTEGFLTIASLMVLFGYHLVLYRQIRRHPSSTAIGLSARARAAWVGSVMEEGRDLLAVQTLRNMMMGASFLASTAVLIIVGLLNLVFTADKLPSLVYRLSLLGVEDETVVLSKLVILISVFFVAFVSFTLAIRNYSHVSFLINVPPARDPDVQADVVGRFLDRAAINYTVGMRGYYFAIPVTLWLFGPVWFLAGSIGLILLLYRHDLLSANIWPFD